MTCEGRREVLISPNWRIGGQLTVWNEQCYKLTTEVQGLTHLVKVYWKMGKLVRSVLA